jgi:hypothetical protein
MRPRAELGQHAPEQRAARLRHRVDGEVAHPVRATLARDDLRRIRRPVAHPGARLGVDARDAIADVLGQHSAMREHALAHDRDHVALREHERVRAARQERRRTLGEGGGRAPRQGRARTDTQKRLQRARRDVAEIPLHVHDLVVAVQG